ncbi:unnamed protein product [Closterium sp. NIES-64]|nr:unnamed protein product [Closterium sp. NIES-64]
MLVEATRFLLDDQQRVEGGRKGYAGADRTRVSVGGGRTVEAWRLPYRMLLKLTDPQHGKPLDTAACILLAIGPHILMTHADVTATSSNSSKAPSLVSPSLLRSRALDFVTSDILTKAPKESVPAVESLMRYLCLHAPERAEGRAAAVEAVMKVYETVGRKEREGFFLFVGKLARVDRAAARVVALDLSAALVERMAMTWGRGVRGQGSMGSGAMEEGGGGGSRDGEGGDPGIEKGSGEAASGERGTESGREGGDGEGDKGDEVSLSQGSASEGDAHSGRESGNGTGVGNDSRESGDSSGNGSVRDVLISRVGGCLELMFRRASDASPTVRARALVALTATLRILKGRPSLLDAPDASIGRGSGLSGESEPGEALGAGTGGSVLSVEEVLGMVRRRLEDEKGLVRKAAVGALEELVGLSRLPLREELVDAIGELCSDSLLSVRRVALNALSKLTMSNPGHVWLRAKWLQSALVLILDNEATVQDQALDLLSSLLLQPLGLISASPRPSAASRMSLCKDRPLHVCVGRRGVPPAPVLCEGEGVCEVCGRAAGGEGAGAAGGGNAAAGEAGAPVVAEGSVRSVVAWLMAVGQGSSSVVPLLHRACAVLARRNALHARLVEGLQAVIEAAEGWQNAQQQPQQQQQQQPNGKGSSVGKAAGVKGAVPAGWRDGRKQQEARAARPESVSATPALDHDAAESATPGFGSRDLGGQERRAGVLHGQVKEAEVLDGQEREAQVHVLKALCNVAARIPGEKAADVAAGLLHNLRSFQLSPEELCRQATAIIQSQLKAGQSWQGSPGQNREEVRAQQQQRGEEEREEQEGQPEEEDEAKEEEQQQQEELEEGADGQPWGQRVECAVFVCGQLALIAGELAETLAVAAASGAATAGAAAAGAPAAAATAAAVAGVDGDSGGDRGAAAGGRQGWSGKSKGRGGASRRGASECEQLVLLQSALKEAFQCLLELLLGNSNSSAAPPVPVAAPAAATNPGTAAAAAKGAAAGVRVPVLAHGWLALGRFSLELQRSPLPSVRNNLVVDLTDLSELQRSPLPSVRNNLVIILTDLCVRHTAFVDPHELQRSPLPSVRNNLVIILTDLCVRHTAFVDPHELQRSPLPSVRNNLVIILTDLCVRYTALVDPHVPCISACLRDPCELVRRQTLVLLAGLLQRDYVKWRGALVLRVLLCIVDESQAIREVALYLFTHVVPRLLQKDYVKRRGALVLRVLLCIVDESSAIRDVALHIFTHVVPRRVPLVPYNTFIEALFALNACPLAPSSTTTALLLPYSPLSTPFHPSPSLPTHPTGRVPLVPYNIFIEAFVALNACPFAPSSTTNFRPCAPRAIQHLHRSPLCSQRLPLCPLLYYHRPASPLLRPRPSSSSPPNPASANPSSEERGAEWKGRRAEREGLDEDLERFSLSGPSRHVARTTVYRTLLPPHGSRAPSRSLCQALPTGARALARRRPAAILPLRASRGRDALDVLSCKEMRPGSFKAAGADEDGARALARRRPAALLPSVQAVVGDALDVLSCKEMRPGSGKAAGAEEDGEEEAGGSAGGVTGGEVAVVAGGQEEEQQEEELGRWRML